MERGSTIELICNATGKPEPPHDVEWFKGGAKINSDAANGLIITKKIETKVLVSILVIRSSKMADSGEYTCRSSNQESETIKVHVLNGRPTTPYARAHTHTHTHVQAQTRHRYTHTHANTHLYTYTHVHTHIYIHMHTHAHTLKHVRTHTHTLTHAYLHAYSTHTLRELLHHHIHVYTYLTYSIEVHNMCTCTNTYLHANIHMYVRT